jgi:septal ring-binding cell division protein DamX
MDILLWHEHEADQRVISALISELNRRHPMSKFVMLDGQLIKVVVFENVDRAELEELAGTLRAELLDVEAALGSLPVEAQPEAPVEPAPAPEPAPEAPAEPVVAAEPVAEQPAAPAPETPTVEAPAEPIVLQ